jgi:hypothetical protein
MSVTQNCGENRTSSLEYVPEKNICQYMRKITVSNRGSELTFTDRSGKRKHPYFLLSKIIAVSQIKSFFS